MQYVPDYKLNLIEPAAMTDEEVERFQTDLRNVVLYIRCGRNKQKLNELLTNDMSFQNICGLTAELLNEIIESLMPITKRRRM